MTNLTAELRRCDRHIQLQFDALQYPQKVQVSEAFKRHVQACEKNGVQPEPMYLTEIVNEVRANR